LGGLVGKAEIIAADKHGGSPYNPPSGSLDEGRAEGAEPTAAIGRPCTRFRPAVLAP
jgi:hypothetical protein